jgi:hypothetical protein
MMMEYSPPLLPVICGVWQTEAARAHQPEAAVLLRLHICLVLLAKASIRFCTSESLSQSAGPCNGGFFLANIDPDEVQFNYWIKSSDLVSDRIAVI